MQMLGSQTLGGLGVARPGTDSSQPLNQQDRISILEQTRDGHHQRIAELEKVVQTLLNFTGCKV